MSRLIPLWAVFQPNLSENAFLMKQFRRYWQRAGGIGRKKKLLVIFRRSSQVISSNSSKYWKEPDAKTQSQHNKTVVDWLTLRRERRFWVYQAAVSLCPVQTNDDLLRLRRYLGGIAVSIFIYCNPPNALLSKKAITHQRDIPAMSMNCQYI